MRGDPPCSPLEFVATISSTPHARGSTQIEQILEHIYPVYPACAGIHLLVVDTLFSGGRLPRMRGDPPLFTIMVTSFLKSTPNARGSTNHCWRQSETNPVYPACAGIHLPPLRFLVKETGLPRMRGDPPYLADCYGCEPESTPHARGSTEFCHCLPPPPKVYPACAGIHLRMTSSPNPRVSLPRMRGDPPF